MKQWLQSTALIGCIIALSATNVFSQYSPKNDTTAHFSATTNSYGRIKTYDGSEGKYDSGTDKMIDRFYQLVGYDTNYVWNIHDDPDVNLVDTVVYSLDESRYARQVVMDNSYRESPPFPINVSTTVQQFENENYGLVAFQVKNTSDAPKVFKFSALLRTKLLNVFGGETMEYDSETNRVYVYNTEGAVGIVALTDTAKGINFLDYDEYDSDNPEDDNASDFARWDAISTETFPDAPVTAGENGGWAFINLGDTPELAIDEEYTVWFAITHGKDLDVVDVRLDSAITRYNEEVGPFQSDTSPFLATTNSYGRIKSYDGSEGKFDAGTDKMIDRLYQLVGYDSEYVWNTNDDPDVNIVDDVTVSLDGSQYFRELVMDNSYRDSPPFPLNVSTVVFLQKGHNYGIAEFGVTNVSDSPKTFKISVLLRTKLLNVFGGETMEFDQETGRLYVYNGEGAVGIQAIDDLTGVNLLDYDEYDSDNPEDDNARDFARWDAMSVDAFPDASINAGENGGFAFLNFGDTPELAVNEEASVSVIFTHGKDLDVVDARLDSAVVTIGLLQTSTDDNREISSRPSIIQLSQNFPNPFNPSTTIQFSVPTAQFVTLEVYNVLGQKVATLVDGIQSAGINTVKFDASRLSTGMYLYRLTAGGQSVVRKMSLIK